MDMDVYNSGEKEMSLSKVMEFLREHIREEFMRHYGIVDEAWIDRVTDNWFSDERNYDGRWNLIGERIPNIGKVLDMAAGCGTFVLYGLRNGYEVWGVEPEEWKRDYFQRKVRAAEYPLEFLDHITNGVGEALPFEDLSFDIVTTYQTLEHVRDYKRCIREMIRVLRPGGVLYIRAPDYTGFFEPHYRVPFLPRMNRKLASLYLGFIGKPLSGLSHLQWITGKEVIKILNETDTNLSIEHLRHYYSHKRLASIHQRLPEMFKKTPVSHLVNSMYEFKITLDNLLMTGRRERNIDLWITKIE
jgi:ubiquinone/menaquinone biosynthesis C-methylase UbiE